MDNTTGNSAGTGGYSVMTVTLGNEKYTVPQAINKLASIGMTDSRIETFLNSQGIR